MPAGTVSLYHISDMQLPVTINTESAAETEHFGEAIGRRLRGGEIIELASDLGGGKTTFVHGLARGAGSTDHVSSPTFTVSKIYKTPRFDIHHFDFYRLQEAGLMEHELHDLLDDPKIVIIVEWGDIVRHVLPDKRLTIEIIQASETSRELRAACHTSLSYLLETEA